MTGQKRDMTELKLVWPVITTVHLSKIILSPDFSGNIIFRDSESSEEGSLVDSVIVSVGQLSADGRLDEELRPYQMFPSLYALRFLPVSPI